MLLPGKKSGEGSPVCFLELMYDNTCPRLKEETTIISTVSSDGSMYVFYTQYKTSTIGLFKVHASHTF